jgi:hypothetical protein
MGVKEKADVTGLEMAAQHNTSVPFALLLSLQVFSMSPSLIYSA